MSSSPPSEPDFVASCPLQVATGDHPLVTIVEPERAVVVSLPDGRVLAEIGLRGEAEGVDVAWVGQPPRLLVVSRLPEYTLTHLLDVTGDGGARLCAEKRVEVAMRLVAVSGAYGLLAGATRTGAASTAIVTRTDDNLSIHPVAARGVPSAAGALGTQLVVAFTGVIEIWDPVARVAKRRLKLPRPAQISAVGGSDRQIWLTTITEPSRLEVLPLVNRGQPRAHELPEAIGSVAGHPKLDVVVCAGAESGRLYVVDLEGKTPMRALDNEVFGGRPMAMGLIGGRAPAIVGIAGQQPPRAVWLDGTPVREWPVTSPPPGRAATEPPVVPMVPLMPYVPIPNRPLGGPLGTGTGTGLGTGTGTGLGAGGAGAGATASEKAGQGAASSSSSASAPSSSSSSASSSSAPPAPQGALTTSPAHREALAAPAASSPGEPLASSSSTVFDSKLGHSVADPGERDPDATRASISSSATKIPRTPRPGREDHPASTNEGEPPASPAPAPASPAAAALIDRLQTWRERTSSEENAEWTEPSQVALPLPTDQDSMLPGHVLPSEPVGQGALPTPTPTPIPISSGTTTPVPPATAVLPPVQAAAVSAPAPISPASAPSDFAPLAPDERIIPLPADWRQALIEWTRAVDNSPLAAPRQAIPVTAPVAAMLDRLELDRALAPAIQLLYGAHLLGHRSLAPAEVASVLGETLDLEARWREALGAGELGRLGLVTLRRSRLRLCGAAIRLLDDRLAKYGTLVGQGRGTPRATSAALLEAEVEDPDDETGDETGDPTGQLADRTPLQLAAAASVAVDSPVLAIAWPLSTLEELRAASLEARLRGAIAAVPYPWLQQLPADAPALYLAPNRDAAEATGFEVVVLPPATR